MAALQKAQRFWQLSNDTKNPWVWTVIQNSFKPVIRMEKVWIPDLDFVAAVWSDEGTYDENVGRRLAESYHYQNQYSKSADVFLNILRHTTEPSSGIVVDCLKALQRAKRNSEVEELIGDYRARFNESPDFIKSWTEYALNCKHNSFINELATTLFINILEKSDPWLPLILLAEAGLSTEAKTWARQLIDTDIPYDLSEIVRYFEDNEKMTVFQKYILPHLPNEERKDILSRIRRPTLLRIPAG